MTKIAKDWTAWPRESLGMLHSYGLEICLIKALPSFRIDKMIPHHYRTKTTTVPYSTVHSEKQLGSSLSSRVSAPPSALLVFWEDQNPLLVPICIWISLQEWEPRGRSREWLDCYKKRWLISYRIAFSLHITIPRLAGLPCCSCQCSIPDSTGIGAFPAWQFQ